MKKRKKRFFTVVLALAIALTSVSSTVFFLGPMQVQAASVKLNKTKMTLKKDQTLQLKLTGTSKKTTWKSSKKSVVTVNSKGLVKAKKTGSAKITAKAGGRTYTCKVTVKKSGTADKEKSEVLKLINKERRSRGKSSLRMDVNLNAAADVRAKEIAKSFSHMRPNGTSCFTILGKGKYKTAYAIAGENIAAGYPDAKAVMKGWMNSPGHKQNILTKGYDAVGIGYYRDNTKPYRYYWVQIFIKSR